MKANTVGCEKVKHLSLVVLFDKNVNCFLSGDAKMANAREHFSEM